VFVRLKRVKLARKNREEPEYSLHAVLVENRRKEGRPRQQIVAYLGSIREQHFYDPVQRSKFLKELQMRIRKLDLDPVTVAKIHVNLINRFVHKRVR
jgi:hypothetical protein